MTRKQLELRMKANIARYIDNDKKTCVDTIMELYSRIPDVGGNVKPLYRYRSLNQYEISSLENETIFMRWPSSYDDKSDCTPVFDIKEISEYIVKKKYPFLDLKKADKDLIKAEGIMEDPRFVKKIDEMRNMWMIACFTERYDNSKMWKQYASNSSGICLVYSFYDVLETIKHIQGMSIMPVRYVDARDKCKDICLNHRDLLADESESKYQLTCTTKERLSYSFEEEWRLIFEREKKNTDGIKIGDCISFVNPIAIICGKLVNKESSDYRDLTNIAKKKGIPCYMKEKRTEQH